MLEVIKLFVRRMFMGKGKGIKNLRTLMILLGDLKNLNKTAC